MKLIFFILKLFYTIYCLSIKLLYFLSEFKTNFVELLD